jgi:hypothetical protein
MFSMDPPPDYISGTERNKQIVVVIVSIHPV